MRAIEPVSSAMLMILAGRHHALFRMVEAHQRFEARDAAVAEADDRLEIGLEPVLLQRRLDVLFHFVAFAGAVEHAGVEDQHAVLAVALAGIHRHVGFQQQFGRVRGVFGIKRDADAGADAKARCPRCASARARHGADAVADFAGESLDLLRH